MSALFALHAQAFFSSLGRMWRSPIPTLFTIMAIGVILCLPIGLHMLTLNIQAVATQWENQPQLSLFLAKNADTPEVDSLYAELDQDERFSTVRLLLAEDALEEFKTTTGLVTIEEYVPDNPIPNVIVVFPAESHHSPESMRLLAEQLGKLDPVETVQVDLEWVQRLHAFIQVARILFALISTILVLAAVLLIGNTTRMAVANRSEEITVFDNIGGTKAFIRRPFIYSGVLHGLFSLGIAYLITELVVTWVAGPVNELAKLYESNFQIQSIPWIQWLLFLLITMLFSWAASRLAVDAHLRRLTPKN